MGRWLEERSSGCSSTDSKVEVEDWEDEESSDSESRASMTSATYRINKGMCDKTNVGDYVRSKFSDCHTGNL